MRNSLFFNGKDGTKYQIKWTQLGRHMRNIIAAENGSMEYMWREQDYRTKLSAQFQTEYSRTYGIVVVDISDDKQANAPEKVVASAVYKVDPFYLLVDNVSVQIDSRRNGIGKNVFSFLYNKSLQLSHGGVCTHAMMLNIRETNLDSQLF